MTTDFDTILNRLRTAMSGLTADLERQVDETGSGAICHLLHKDLGLPQTPRDLTEDEQEAVDSDPLLAADAIDFTEEHAKLHAIIGGILMNGQVNGYGASDIVALALAAGRRMGLMEASAIITSSGSDS